MKDEMKRVKISLIITTAAIVLGLAGVIIELVTSGRWDAAGTGILASNCCIFCCNYPIYKKLLDENKK